jgi:glyoxylase-like metal-dependent hydrolase (beta-lactamase superfamily II)
VARAPHDGAPDSSAPDQAAPGDVAPGIVPGGTTSAPAGATSVSGAAGAGAAGALEAVTGRAGLLLAPNPGPMTFEGTNSWVLAEPGSTSAVVLDPGPDHPGHLAALAAAAADRGCGVEVILLSHGHPDHTAGAAAFARMTGATVLAASPGFADEIIADGAALDIGGLRIDVIATPGHSSDSLSFHLPAENTLLSGDTVLGRSAPVILDPDGRVDQMIASLTRLRELLDDGQPVVLPGHGPVVREPLALLSLALEARQSRLDQVAAAVSAGMTSLPEIAAHLYGQYDPRISRMIEATVRAHLRYLRDHRGLADSISL